jgi:hypothetical protein
MVTGIMHTFLAALGRIGPKNNKNPHSTSHNHKKTTFSARINA